MPWVYQLGQTLWTAMISRMSGGARVGMDSASILKHQTNSASCGGLEQTRRGRFSVLEGLYVMEACLAQSPSSILYNPFFSRNSRPGQELDAFQHLELIECLPRQSRYRGSDKAPAQGRQGCPGSLSTLRQNLQNLQLLVFHISTSPASPPCRASRSAPAMTRPATAHHDWEIAVTRSPWLDNGTAASKVHRPGMPSGGVWLSLRPWVRLAGARLAIQSIQEVQTVGRVARPWGRAVGDRTKAPRNTVSCLGFLLSPPLFSFSLLCPPFAQVWGYFIFLHSVLHTRTGQDPFRFLICCCSLSIFCLDGLSSFFFRLSTPVRSLLPVESLIIAHCRSLVFRVVSSFSVPERRIIHCRTYTTDRPYGRPIRLFNRHWKPCVCMALAAHWNSYFVDPEPKALNCPIHIYTKHHVATTGHGGCFPVGSVDNGYRGGNR
jgi:hypothetical protein